MFKRMITTSECLSPESTKSLQIGKKVSLAPLKAQVGGHVYMKLLNDNHVCKPLNDREVKFYQNTPKNLLQHVPKFLGTVQIQQQQQHNGESSSRYKIVDNLTFNTPEYCAICFFSKSIKYFLICWLIEQNCQLSKSFRSLSKVDIMILSGVWRPRYLMFMPP